LMALIEIDAVILGREECGLIGNQLGRGAG
jgi:hypothetical protein